VRFDRGETPTNVGGGKNAFKLKKTSPTKEGQKQPNENSNHRTKIKHLLCGGLAAALIWRGKGGKTNKKSLHGIEGGGLLIEKTRCPMEELEGGGQGGGSHLFGTEGGAKQKKGI